ncbi:small ribosomal subunit protein mS23 isoform X1 [Neodiprion pinetum]|uniref:Small ribosomal subunit protein mS23 n=2 Tax=Neodiprion lecontei TaxID=441921 RepID=A0A6J0BVC8_NEOLC|nr:probable 28S ribosomal protein S23, mitochondrial isoform X1 [Neodiprion lecontei]XP_046486026.1 probable 28S ribosomal protein S23, mitochondrial isoform X1 [Neodiprion pinetum]XP_046486027.1 probable 28S ribosomal protein S23, mitochondrial isoform X1 [Neodiprion pinetum]XP_046595847.1 probable 28S ribosomal protein S23, mitochondrial isoform X1 [Neodiprion lecontei]XP_046595849.1 probable 28S ribosomal protein S23, mitochondrial isoform X1 [Neodiprion lecontei]
MARSRLAKIGTIHSRTSGLLRSGAMKEEDKPLWFDIYEAFQPKDEPRFDRPISTGNIREIFYEEDVIRAKFHKDHPSLPFVHLNDTSRLSQTQKFIATYQELSKEGGVQKSELYKAAVSQVIGQAVRSRIDKPQPSEETTSVADTEKGKTTNLNVNINNILKEQ